MPHTKQQPARRHDGRVPLPAAALLFLAAAGGGWQWGRWSGRSAAAWQGDPLPTDAGGGTQLAACLQASGLRPPVPAGASGNAAITLAPYQVLSLYPRIALYPGFIDAARAAHIIQLAHPRLVPSTVRTDGRETRAAGRSSSGVFLDTSDDPAGVLAWLERRIQDATLLPASHGERFYAIRYGAGERYNIHMDPHAGAATRVATMIVVLADPGASGGGETIFPREGEDGAELPVGASSCELQQGLRYRPRIGDALLFYSVTPDGQVDPHAAHGGCPVGDSGSEKWVLTRWMHSQPLPRATGGFGW